MSDALSGAIAELNNLCPELNAVPSEDFDGRTGGIWFRSEGVYIDGLPALGTAMACSTDADPDVLAILDKYDVYLEPYDAGTWFAYDR